MLGTADQMTGPNGLTLFEGTHVFPGGKKCFFFKINFFVSAYF